MSTMASNIRGLTVFISDVRNCATKEDEDRRVKKEFANIRGKFKEGNMDGYSKKKYVLKLIYMSLLGYEIDIGHMVALGLLGATKFSEKCTGYLACSVLLNEKHPFLNLIVNSIHQDLISRSEVNQCLALSCVATVSNREMGDALYGPVTKLLMDGGATSPFVRKKAALCLLRFFRLGAGDLSGVENFVDRCKMLVGGRDLGVVSSVLSLVTGVAARASDGGSGGGSSAAVDFAPLVPTVVKLLHSLVVDKFGPECSYYSIPSPWVTVKALRFLQFTDPPADRQALNVVLTRIFSSALQQTNSRVNVTAAVHNANHAILFEAIHLAVHQAATGSAEAALMTQIATMLGKFISSSENPNIRYLGLYTMDRLVTATRSAAAIRPHKKLILAHLRDPDISIRKRALDLVYSLCDRDSAEEIVLELLSYLPEADVEILDALVLKIAILSEKFAPTYAWYVDQIVHLLTEAGDHVSDEIWFRVVQIVTNNADIQKYAAKICYTSLGNAHVHANMVKMGGYILGEFGHTIAEDGGGCATPQQQFQRLHRHFDLASPMTRAILLSAYGKLGNAFAEIRPGVDKVLRAHANSVDAEVQQRSAEYTALLGSGGQGVAQSVLALLPEFPQDRANPLIKRLEEAKVAAADPSRGATEAPGPAADNDAAGPGPATVSGIQAPSASATAASGGVGGGGKDEDLLGLGDSGGADAPAAPAAEAAAPTPAASSDPPSTDADLLGELAGVSLTSTAPPPASAAPGAAQLKEWFVKLCVAPAGVLYEDDTLQIGVKSEYNGPRGTLSLFFGNKSAGELTGVETAVAPGPEVQVSASTLAPTLAAKAQSQQVVEIVCSAPFAAAPPLRVSFTPPSGEPRSVTLKLPLVVSKLTAPLDVAPTFMDEWRAIAGGPPREVQAVFKAASEIEVQGICGKLHGLNLKTLGGVDPNQDNIVAAGTFTAVPASGQVSVPVFARLETNKAQQMIRLTVRTKSGALSASFHALITSIIGA